MPPVMPRPKKLTAVRASGPTELSAVLPDGSVEHLLWIRDRQVNWKQAPYTFRGLYRSPAGTGLNNTGAQVEISVAARP